MEGRCWGKLKLKDLFSEGPYDVLLTCHLVQGRIIDATKECVDGLTVFAMQGTADHYAHEAKLSRYHDYEVIVEATKDKVNGLKDASKCPAAPLKPENGTEL